MVPLFLNYADKLRIGYSEGPRFMWSRRCAWVAVVLAGMCGAGLAQTASGISSWGAGVGASVGAQTLVDSGAEGLASAAESSSLGMPAAKSAVMLTPQPRVKKESSDGRLRPFSRIALATSSGTVGYGGQIATPIVRWLNLRAGIDLFNFDYGLGVDGANYEGELHLKSGQASVDFFPCHCGFHLSPGVMIFRSAASASVTVPGGSTFELGNQAFTSSASDPVSGSANINFTRTMMPMFTFGFSNMIAKGKRHLTVPLELGAAYTGAYSAQLKLSGTACVDPADCMSTNTAEFQQSLTEEQREINEPMKHFQLYPIVILGIAYKF
jgi:hypothetical protein